jgi:methylase of polypeptide subunit release factors
VANHVRWQEDGHVRQARWASHHPRPDSIVVAGDELRADYAVRLARRNRAVLWRGDYRNARQLLAAMKRRVGTTPATTFEQHRQDTAARARIMNRVLVEFDPGYRLDLPNAPDMSRACLRAFGPADEPVVLSLTEVLGAVGADQWRERGVLVPVLDATIHPYYGVFAPTRQEYLDLVATAPWPRVTTAFDIGTGTGVLAALLARRGAETVVATDIEAHVVACARDNVDRLGLSARVRVEQRDLFPDGEADLVVCNPPWLPGTPTSPLDAAIYDPGTRTLRGFLRGLPDHLTRQGEGWLVLSDLAERLGLRTRGELVRMVAAAGLRVIDRLDTRARHRTTQRADPLARHRAAEITSLWRLTRT